FVVLFASLLETNGACEQAPGQNASVSFVILGSQDKIPPGVLSLDVDGVFRGITGHRVEPDDLKGGLKHRKGQTKSFVLLHMEMESEERILLEDLRVALRRIELGADMKSSTTVYVYLSQPGSTKREATMLTKAEEVTLRRAIYTRPLATHITPSGKDFA